MKLKRILQDESYDHLYAYGGFEHDEGLISMLKGDHRKPQFAVRWYTPASNPAWDALFYEACSLVHKITDEKDIELEDWSEAFNSAVYGIGRQNQTLGFSHKINPKNTALHWKGADHDGSLHDKFGSKLNAIFMSTTYERFRGNEMDELLADILPDAPFFLAIHTPRFTEDGIEKMHLIHKFTEDKLSLDNLEETGLFTEEELHELTINPSSVSGNCLTLQPYIIEFEWEDEDKTSISLAQLIS